MFKRFGGGPQPVAANTTTKDTHDTSSVSSHDAEPVPRRGDEEIMEELSPLYDHELSDVVTFVLDKVLGGESGGSAGAPPPSASSDESIDGTWLENVLWEHERACNVVDTELCKKVEENYSEFVEGMQRIHEVGINLQQSGIMCQVGQRSLTRAKNDLACSCIKLTALYRRKLRYTAMMTRLQSISATVKKMQELEIVMREGDNPRAIMLCSELQAITGGELVPPIPELRGIKCVSLMAKTLEHKNTLLQERLDASLYKSCKAFSPETYETVLKAYQTLRNMYQVLEKVQRCFMDSVDEQMKHVMLTFILSDASKDPESLKRADIPHLQGLVKLYDFANCLITILETEAEVMWNYYSMKKWHEDYLKLVNEEQDKNMQELLDGLERHRKRLWDKMQKRVAEMLDSVPLSRFQVDDVCRMLEAVQKFAEIGMEFSQTSTSSLVQTLKRQGKMYFEAYHKSSLEDIKAMIGNESWSRTPVQISVFDIPNIKPFVNSGGNSQSDTSTHTVRTDQSVFVSWKANGNPIKMFSQEMAQQDQEDEAEHDDTEEKENPELKKDWIEEDDAIEQEQHTKKVDTSNNVSEQIIATVTINIARTIGKYLHMLRVLESINLDVFGGITQIFDFYVHSIYSFFGGVPGQAQDTASTVSAGKSLLGLLTNFQIVKSTQQPTPATESIPKASEFLGLSKLSSMIDIHNPNTLYSLAHRIVGIDSLLFLKHVLITVKPALLCVFKGNPGPVNKFYSDSVDVIDTLRSVMYRNVSTALLNLDNLPAMIFRTRWEGSDSEHAYVNVVQKEVTQFSHKFEGICAEVKVPQPTSRLIWEHVCLHLMDLLLDGFSRVTKCPFESRAIMSLDLQSIVGTLETLSHIKPPPGAKIVNDYIKAFYLAENEFVPWCNSHTEFTQRQLVNLFQCSASYQTKSRQHKDVQVVIEGICKGRVQRPLWYVLQAQQHSNTADLRLLDLMQPTINTSTTTPTNTPASASSSTLRLPSAPVGVRRNSFDETAANENPAEEENELPFSQTVHAALAAGEPLNSPNPGHDATPTATTSGSASTTPNTTAITPASTTTPTSTETPSTSTPTPTALPTPATTTPTPTATAPASVPPPTPSRTLTGLSRLTAIATALPSVTTSGTQPPRTSTNPTAPPTPSHAASSLFSTLGFGIGRNTTTPASPARRSHT
ncbi:syndetin [Pelomyxa schiedti]|nr:syndetin [Pelomyxa schiedti]